MLAVKHVGPRQQHHPRRQIRIIGDDQPALATVQMLVGLRRIAGHRAMPARGHAVPFRPHGMGAILDDGQAQTVAQGNQRLHVADMPAHVRQQQKPRAGVACLGGQIGKVDHQTFGDLDENRFAARRRDRPRHRRQGEGIGQHRLSGRHPAGAQGAAHRIAARGDGQTVTRPGEGGELLLQRRGLAGLARRGVVAVQPTVAHHLQCRRDARLGDRLLLGKTAPEPFARSLHQPFSRRARTMYSPVVTAMQPAETQ